MHLHQIRAKLLSLFAPIDLGRFPGEWAIRAARGDGDITRIGYSVSIRPETVEQAHRQGVNLLITHHDAWRILFLLRRRTHALLERYGIHHVYVHGPLDQAPFGTNGAILDRLHAGETESFAPGKGLLWGRIGELPLAIPFDDFRQRVSEIIGHPPRQCITGSHTVRRVGVVTGAGCRTRYLHEALKRGCDAYITGEHLPHFLLYARLARIGTLVYRHASTEILGVENMVRRLVDGEAGVEVIRLDDRCR